LRLIGRDLVRGISSAMAEFVMGTKSIKIGEFIAELDIEACQQGIESGLKKSWLRRGDHTFRIEGFDGLVQLLEIQRSSAYRPYAEFIGFLCSIGRTDDAKDLVGRCPPVHLLHAMELLQESPMTGAIDDAKRVVRMALEQMVKDGQSYKTLIETYGKSFSGDKEIIEDAFKNLPADIQKMAEYKGSISPGGGHDGATPSNLGVARDDTPAK